MTVLPPAPAAPPSHPWRRVLVALALGAAAALFAADAASLTGASEQAALRRPSLNLLPPSDWVRLASCLAGAALSASLAVSVLAGAAAALPGRPGQWGRSIERRSAPPLLRRAVALALTTWAAAPAVGAMAAPTHGAPAYVLATPPTTAPYRGGSTPGTQPPDPGLPDPRLRPDEAAGRVRVRPGDCLWSIAAGRLGPDADDRAVAQAWPRWFEANRQLIADPDLIYPGQLLGAPAETSGGAGR